MKKLLCILLFAFAFSFAFAQTPQSFKYQAVARDASGNELATANLNVRATIHDSTITGNTLYQETFTVITNQFGLFSINIGEGVVITGTFSTINWGKNDKFIQIEVNFGSGYQNMGTSQLLSVPYALYSTNSLNAANIIPHGKQVFTTSGTFVVPANVTTIWVSMCGGGGGGGGGTGGAPSGSGGGGADAIIATSYTATPSQNITVTIGTGGTGRSFNQGGGTGGGASTFGTLTTNGGGGGNNEGFPGGSGGAGGSSGTSGVLSSDIGGAGGGCIFGAGGGGVNANAGGNGGGYGSGGGGGVYGGNGAAGFVLVEW